MRLLEDLKEYLECIDIEEQKVRMKEIFEWIDLKFPQLEGTIKWNQPMFLDHGTFIIGFSIAKKHISFTPTRRSCYKIIFK